jgi:hypothetical protein
VELEIQSSSGITDLLVRLAVPHSESAAASHAPSQSACERNLFLRFAVLLRETGDNGGGVAVSQVRDPQERIQV